MDYFKSEVLYLSTMSVKNVYIIYLTVFHVMQIWFSGCDQRIFRLKWGVHKGWMLAHCFIIIITRVKVYFLLFKVSHDIIICNTTVKFEECISGFLNASPFVLSTVW